MKILYYSPHPDLNLQDNAGYAVHMRETIASLRNLGHEVDVFIAGGNEKAITHVEKEKQKGSGLKSLAKKLLPRLIWQSLRDFRLIRFDRNLTQLLEKKVQQSRPDLIYERGYYLMDSGSQVAKTMGVKHIIELNAPYPDERIAMGGRSFLLRKANRLMAESISKSNGLVVVSSSLAKFYREKFQVEEAKLFVSPNGCRLEGFNFNQQEARHKLRLKHNILESTVLFGFIGSVFPYHGVDRFLEAYNKLLKLDLHQKKLDAKIIIVGGGMIEEYRARYRNHDSVIFTGEVNRETAYHYLAAMDVAVMPDSNWYGSPIKVFEYGAMKKPIIAPRRQPLLDVMEHEQDGLLVQGVDELAQAMMTMIENQDKRIEMGNTFGKKVEENYQWDTLVSKMLDYFEGDK